VVAFIYVAVVIHAVLLDNVQEHRFFLAGFILPNAMVESVTHQFLGFNGAFVRFYYETTNDELERNCKEALMKIV
jgi:hypothetical protein